MGLIETLKQWMVFGRMHTAILETPLAVLGAAMGLGTVWDYRILLWVGFGLLYHAVGYSMNSYVDWKKGFDKDDPRKQHHPLNTGAITPDAAKKATIGGMCLLIVYGLVIGGFSKVAILSVSVMIVSGVAYNYFGKYTDFKFIPISIVHTMVFVYPFILYSDEVTLPFILISVAYFTHHSFQIMISGDIKDIDQDEASLIKRMGATVDYGIVHNTGFSPGATVLFISYGMMVLQLGLSTAASATIAGADIYVLPILPLGFWMLYEGDKVVESGPFNREKRVEYMSRKELAGYLTIHASMIPVLGFKAFLVIGVSMFAYLFTTSKFMWGNWLKPKV